MQNLRCLDPYVHHARLHRRCQVPISPISALLPRDLKLSVDVNKIKRRTYIVDLDQYDGCPAAAPFIAALRSATVVGDVEADRVGARDGVATQSDPGAT